MLSWQRAHPAVAAAQGATGVIPIVMATISDPVGSGFIASLGQPGGNITGLFEPEHRFEPEALADVGQHCSQVFARISAGQSLQIARTFR